MGRTPGPRDGGCLWKGSPMRVLLTTPSVPARLHNLVPLGWALRTAGHQVQIAGRPKFTETITATGFVAVAVGDDGSETTGHPGLADQSDVDGLVDYVRLWGPELVIWDATATAGSVAAQHVGAASVRVLGLPGDERDDNLPTLNHLPPSLRATVGNQVAVRFAAYAGPSVLPAWLRRKPRRGRVYVRIEPSAEFFAAAAKVRGAEFVCELDESQIPSGTTIPANVRLFDAVPLDAVLPTCSAVVHDGTAPAPVAALAAGLPQLALGTDTDFAHRIAHAGAGLVRDAVDIAALQFLVSDQDLREAAQRIAAEIAAMPSPREIVPALTEQTR